MVTLPSSIVYPESDGLPMADNTRQFESIVYIKKGIDWLFCDDPNVFVAGDLLWYPVEGNAKLCQAPDVMAVFGRPKGDRGSYQQWREGNIPPQVVFEILSPGNTVREMTRKFQFYARYGVEEYYIYDPDGLTLDGYVKQEDFLEAIETMQDWVSPRLGIRFGLSSEGNLKLFRPDGQPFETYEQLAQRAEQLTQTTEQLTQRVEQAEQRSQEAEAEIQRLREQLRSLGQNPDQL
jgi:Uma2 family endonuclease